MTEAFSHHADITLWVASIGGKKKEILESYGVVENLSIKELPKSFGVLWPKSFFRALAFRRIIRMAPPDTLFYTRDILLAFFLTLFSPQFRKRFVFECHSLDKFSKSIYRRVFRNARGVVSTNKAKAEVIGSVYGVDARCIFVAPNGFDAKLFDALPSRAEARATVQLPQDQSIVLYAGSLQSWKGVDAVYMLAQVLPHILFVVLGAREEKKENNLWMLSSVSNRRVPSYLRAADVLIAPYRTDSLRARAYFSPIKMMEYLASGTPTVATDLESIREIAGDEYMWLVEQGEVEGFRSAIEYIMAHTEQAHAKAIRGREQVSVLNWEKRAENVVRFVRQLP